MFVFLGCRVFGAESAGLRGEAVPEISASRDVEDHGSVQRCAWAVAGRLQERLERKLLGFGEANPVPILCEAKPIAILSRPAALTY